MTHTKAMLAILVSASLISACGGSGSSSASNATPDNGTGDNTGGSDNSGNNNSGNNNSGSTVQLPSGLTDNDFQLQFTTANNGAPFNLNDIVAASFSTPDNLALDYNPSAQDGNELTLTDAAEDNGEYRWVDSATNVAYVVSLVNSNLNEVNLFSADNNSFLGQFTPYSDAGIDNLELVTALTGTYRVDAVSSGSHSRNTIMINDDGSINFDTNVQFSANQIQIIYDRTHITAEPRVQISYGADDDAEVINLYLTPGDTSKLAAVQFRHTASSIDIQVDVSAESDSGSGSDNSGNDNNSGANLLDGNTGIAANVAGVDITKVQLFNFVNGSNWVVASASDDSLSWSMQFPNASGDYTCDAITSDGDTATDTFINISFIDNGNVRIANTDQANSPKPDCSITVIKDGNNFQGTFSGQLSGHGQLYSVTNGQFNFNLSF